MVYKVSLTIITSCRYKNKKCCPITLNEEVAKFASQYINVYNNRHIKING